MKALLRNPEGRERLANWLLSIGCSVALMAVLAGPLHWWSLDGLQLWGGFIQGILVGLVLISVAVVVVEGQFRKLRLDLHAVSWALVLLFFSDWLTRGFNFYQGPEIRGEILLASLVLGAVFGRLSQKFWCHLSLGSIALLVGCFLARSGGRLLWSDDHPTFIYRLALLKENFPELLFYNPLWNAGLYAGDLLATGSLNVFLIATPLIYLFDVFSSYNFVVLLIAFGLTPFAMFVGARICGLSAEQAAIAAILSVTGNLFWYTWIFKYGTMGFATTLALIPLNLMLVARLIDSNRTFRLSHAALLIVSFSLMLFWTPSGLVFLPAIALSLFNVRSILKRPFVKSIIFALLVVNIPWIVILFKATNVGNFIDHGVFETEKRGAIVRAISEETPTSTSVATVLAVATKELREIAMSSNPLLLLFAVPGIALFTGGTRLLFSITSFWLIVMGTIFVSFKPQMELGRMLLVLTQCLSIPVALAISSLFESARSSTSQNVETRTSLKTILNSAGIRKIGPSLVAGFLLVGPLCGGAVLWNRSPHQYFFSGNRVDQLTASLKEHAGDGRVLFSGFVLHDLSNSHIAPIALMADKPMVARSHVHNMWKRIDAIPEEFKSRGDEGIEEYLDLYNVSLVTAHEKGWRKYFSERSDKYSSVAKVHRFDVFTRKNYKPSYFYSGDGELIEQTTNVVRLRLSTQEAVVKFEYLPNLRTSGCKAERYPIASVNLIQLKDCPVGEEIKLSGKPTWEWLF